MRLKVFGLGCLVLVMVGPLGSAADQTNPYQSIVDRNVFGLREPPPPPAPPAPPPPPPVARPAVRLKGWTSLFGEIRAYIQVTEQGGQPKTLTLTENEREGEIELKSIDTSKNEVVLSIGGFVTNMTFAKKEDKAPAAPPGPPGRVLPIPGQTVQTTPGGPGNPTVISRNSPRSAVTLLGGNPSTPAAPAPGISRAVPPASYNASSTAANRLRSLPTRSIRSRAPNAPPQQPTMTTEEAEILIEAQKMTPEGQDLPFPPTSFSSPGPEDLLNPGSPDGGFPLPQ